MNRMATLIMLLAAAIGLSGCSTLSLKQRELIEVRRICFDDVVHRDTDEIVVTDTLSGDTVYTIKGTNLFNELNAIIEVQGPILTGAHGCWGSAWINFIAQGELKGRWNFAHKHFHGDYLTPDSEGKLAAWFADHGVPEFEKWLIEDGGFPRPKLPVTAGLKRLAETQNADGSWGSATSGIAHTSLAIAAFSGHAETPSSEQYGEAIEKALLWLVEQSPDNDTDTVLAIHGLSTAYFLTDIKQLETKVLALHSTVDPKTLQQPELTLYHLTRHPKIEVTEQQDKLARRYLADLTATARGDDPLTFYLITLNEFIENGDTWKVYNEQVIEPICANFKKTQEFSMKGSTSPFESVVFTILPLEVYYRYWKGYMNLTFEPIEDTGNDVIIDIDI